MSALFSEVRNACTISLKNNVSDKGINVNKY
jgi:hypothetical protein